MKTRTFIALLLGSTFISSCQKATYLSSDKSELITDADSLSGQIVLHSDATDFELAHSPSWVTATLSDSLLNYHVTENSDALKRVDSIVVTSGEIRLCIPFAQYCRCTQLTSETSSILFHKEGGTQEISIITDGLPVVAVDGAAKASYANGKLTVSTEANTGEDAIHGTITLSADEHKLVLPYTINGNKCSTCKGKGKIKCPDCRGYGYVARGYYEIGACITCGGKYEDGSDVEWSSGSGKIKCPDCDGKGS